VLVTVKPFSPMKEMMCRFVVLKLTSHMEISMTNHELNIIGRQRVHVSLCISTYLGSRASRFSSMRKLCYNWSWKDSSREREKPKTLGSCRCARDQQPRNLTTPFYFHGVFSFTIGSREYQSHQSMFDTSLLHEKMYTRCLGRRQLKVTFFCSCLLGVCHSLGPGCLQVPVPRRTIYYVRGYRWGKWSLI